MIRRELISAYLNDYSTIKVKGNNLKNIAASVRQEIQNLMALEIIEQSEDMITTKDFLNVEDISISELIRKMDIIVRSMLLSLKGSLNENKFPTISNMDMDINRLFFAVLRTMKRCFANPAIMHSMKLDYLKLFQFWNIAYYLESMGDHIKWFSKNMNAKEINGKVKKNTASLIDDLEKYYLTTVKTFYNGDIEAAYKASLTKRGLMRKCDEIRSISGNNPTAVCVSENIKGIIEDVHSIVRRVYS